jgi:hypothetical protein
VRRDLIRVVRLLVPATIALVAVVAFVPGRAELSIRLYALLLSAIVLALTVSALRRSYGPAAPLRRLPSKRRPARRGIPGTLARLEQETALGVAGSFDLHHRLRPRLRGLAGDLLATRRNVSFDRDAENARRALGEETWGLVRDDRPPPVERLARGIPISELTRVVESLEKL